MWIAKITKMHWLYLHLWSESCTSECTPGTITQTARRSECEGLARRRKRRFILVSCNTSGSVESVAAIEGETAPSVSSREERASVFFWLEFGVWSQGATADGVTGWADDDSWAAYSDGVSRWTVGHVPLLRFGLITHKAIYASYHKVHWLRILELRLLYDDGYYTNSFDNSILVCTNGLHQVRKSSISTYQDNNHLWPFINLELLSNLSAQLNLTILQQPISFSLYDKHAL